MSNGMKKSVLWCITLLACGALLLGLGNAPGRLYVVNNLSEDLSVIDTARDAVVSTIPLGANGYRLAVSPDGTTAYVTSSPATYNPGPQQQDVTAPQLVVVDLLHARISRRIPLEMAPLATVHLHPNGKQAFVVTAAKPGSRNTERGKVLFIDLAGGRVTCSLPIGLNPLDSALLPDGSKLFTADWASRAISVVDVREARLLDSIPLGAVMRSELALRPDGKRLYLVTDPPVAYNQTNAIAQNAVQNAVPREHARELLEINTADNAIARWPFPGGNGFLALAVTPDGRQLFAGGGNAAAQAAANNKAAQPGGEVLVYDLHEHRVTRRLAAPESFQTLVLSRDGNKLYLIGTPGEQAQEQRVQQRNAPLLKQLSTEQSCQTMQSAAPRLIGELSTLRKTVTVLDVKTGKRLAVVTVGSLPQGIAFGD